MKRKTAFPELAPADLRWTCPPDAIPCDTSEEVKPCDEIIGQERALKAIQTGLDIQSRGYNIFITGMVGTGRTTTIQRLLEGLEKTAPIPDDLLYVNSFRAPDEPTLIALPAGQGRLFRKGMEDLIAMLQRHIPELLKSQHYTEGRDRTIEAQQKKQKEILKAFEDKAAAQGFTLVQVQVGFFSRPELIPVVRDEPVPFPKLEAMVKDKAFDQKELDALRKRYEELSGEMERVFEELRELDEETRRRLRAWDEESITPIIKGAVAEMRARFPHLKVGEYLADVEKNLVPAIDLFKNQKKDKDEPEREPAAERFLAYRVNLMVDNAELKSAPVIMETNPNYPNLFGSIEFVTTRAGFLQTDFTRIKAGSFLKANGGYLVINALDALLEQGVWPTLKRTLRNQIFEVQNFASLYLFSQARLKPEPVKVDVKVVMIGDDSIYNLLYALDEDFKKIFKVKAEFDSEMPKTDRALADYVRFIKKIVDLDRLRPFDRSGIAAVIEYGTRIAGRQGKVSTRFHVISDIIREAAYWAGKAGHDIVGREDVERAVRERFERVSLVEDKIQEMIEEGTILIDVAGEVVGQVNGLSVYDMGQFAFGKPTRITARTAVGRAGVINIEREADLSGPTHNKGVLILGGYLRGQYARKQPFSLSASLAFEQSYGGVDGDSASSTEVYALLSSLSGLPLRQDTAVTGSLNQKGEIQPIGGVNEKIEGFFDVCRAKGLTGSQGVMIPHQNVRNLMLRGDVVEAVAAGKFHIYPVKTIDEGIEILTGVAAGTKAEDGRYEPDTVHGLVERELERLALSLKAFGAGSGQAAEKDA